MPVKLVTEKEFARLESELAEVAAHRDRLQAAILADADRAIAHRATIESIQHGGLKVLARLLNEPEELKRVLAAELGDEPQWLAQWLLDEHDETDAAGVANSWVGR